MYYQATGVQHEPRLQKAAGHSWVLTCAATALLTFIVALVSYDVTVQSQVRNYVASVLPRAAVRPGIVYAAKQGSPFSFGRKDDDDDDEPARASFFGAAPKPAPKSRAPSSASSGALENIGRITGVGAKVTSELALYLAFNTAYFITNTYQFLSKEEQQKLARETVDKQLPELLALLGGTTKALSETVSTVAGTPDYQDLQKSAAQAAEELTKGIKNENTPAPEVVEKLKAIVADEKGEVLSEERKAAVLETMKKGGVKATELSLYLFYNLFSVLRNLDKVLPSAEQSGGIEGKIQDLETKVGELAEQVKELPSQVSKVTEKIEDVREVIPTAEDIANLDPAEVSLSVRAALANAKAKLDDAVASVNKALEEDSEFRKTLKDVSIKLKPLTDGLNSLVAKLPLPKKADGTIDYSKLLADAGIITVKGLKALIEATKKAASSVNAKTEN